MAATNGISTRNKSVVSLRDSLLHGFLRHNNINENSIATNSNKRPLPPHPTPAPSNTILPSLDDDRLCRPAFVSPNNSSNDLRRELRTALENLVEEQHEPREQSNARATPASVPVSSSPPKKRRLSPESTGPATAAVAAAQHESVLVRRRKALAARLRAKGVSQKLMLKPADFARSIFVKNLAKNPTAANDTNQTVFPEPTATDTEIHQKHSHTLYDFVRKGTDLEGFKKCVRELHKEYHANPTNGEEEQPFRCSNRFGESLMHLACRRGRTDMVRFLVEEFPSGTRNTTPQQMLSVRDDCHKTPLHDACWTPSPNFELVDLVLKHAPEQVVMEDCRGNTPLEYVRREDYPLWLRFLWQRRSVLGVQTTDSE
eukprot:CAMPEP_0201121968 /NCGR_PEP_ID=MMETSP0850-20130426/5717_1 /ASSEMBLY_ACC=CAM_ASM_000622 /TAXON_ID=183588 /ORGANISM="Pseudo-nitzschia fraudulenta, Strain WWA7" /LENGTH=371 /DNA_ID=CAMNT_0047388539 /DNA_START=227 /DNA_END=1342 /DNA_ORIENTATION=+